MSRSFNRRKIEFSEEGNESVKRYVFYFTVTYFVVAIILAILLSLIFSDPKGISVGIGLAASVLAANIACSAFTKRHKRMLSMSEYKRLFWSSFWLNTLIQVIVAFLFISGLLLVAKHVSREGLAIMIIIGGTLGFFGNMLFIYLGFKYALVNASIQSGTPAVT